MASRRMFSLDVVDTDKFLEMPASTQNLYFHLGMRADDDGFVSSPRKIAKMVNCGDDDLSLLIAKGFLIPFDDGVIVIAHWKQNNYIRSDRYKGTIYTTDKALLTDDNGVYQLSTNGIPMVYQNATTGIPSDIPVVDNLDTQYRLGKDSIDNIKESKEKRPPNCLQLFEQIIPSYNLSETLKNKAHDWIKYKIERHEPYKEQGLKSLLSQMQKNASDYGDASVCNLIDESMANGWKGIAWDRLTKGKNKFQDFPQSSTDYDAMMVEQVKQRIKGQ